VPGRERLSLLALPLLAALGHFAAVVLIFPWVYGDRLILPAYPLLIPYAAFALEPVVTRALEHPAHAAGVLLTALAVCVFLPATPRTTDAVTVLIFLATTLALPAGPWPRFRLRAVVYLAYLALILFTYVRYRWSGDMGPIRPSYGLLLPIAVFAVARLTVHEKVLWATVAAFVAAAAVSIMVLRPALPEPPVGFDDVTDIARDLSNVVQGGNDAWRELQDDVGAVGRAVVQLPARGLDDLLRQAGLWAGVLLGVMWIQTTVRSWRRLRETRLPAGAFCLVALVVVLVMGLAGIVPGSWQDGRYSMAVLAVLFGLAEAPFTPRQQVSK
jgi:hypothetical protein